MSRYRGLEHRPRTIAQLAQHVGAFLVSQRGYTPWRYCQESVEVLSRVLAGLCQPLGSGGQFTGCREEAGVAKDSDVETFNALRLFIDSWHWAEVPWYCGRVSAWPRPPRRCSSS
jgi:hypothetical protein